MQCLSSQLKKLASVIMESQLRLMDLLPMDIILTNIVPELDGKAKLALALTNRGLYDPIIRSIRHMYGMKWKIGKSIHAMLDFIEAGGPVKASWSLSYNWYVHARQPGCCVSFCKAGKTHHVAINGRAYPGIGRDRVMDWVEKHLFPVWDHVKLSTDFRYRVVDRQLEYRKITCAMLELLSCSLPT